MLIHTVTPSDTIYSISKQYGIPVTRLITDNYLNPSKKLLVGQSLIISFPSKIHAVRGGDSVASIAKENNINVLSLLQNNPQILKNKVTPSQTLNISYDKGNAHSIAVAAYTGAATADKIEKLLPYISILTVQNAAYLNGSQITIPQNASSMSALAKKYHAMPILMIECINERGKYESNCIEKLLDNPNDVENLINNAVTAAKSNGYSGIELNLYGINSYSKYKLVDMLLALHGVCQENNLYCTGSIIPITPFDSSDENTIDIIDYIPLWNYIWDRTDTASPAAPLDVTEKILQSEILIANKDKLLLGIPTFGTEYLKMHSGNQKHIISASDYFANLHMGEFRIEFDERSRTPYIKHNASKHRNGYERVFHFEDARSINEKLDLIDKYNLYGVNIMSLEYDAPVLWQLLNQRYNILKF